MALTNQEPSLSKLHTQPAWDALVTYPENYKHTGLVDDPNQAVGVRFVEDVKPLVRYTKGWCMYVGDGHV